MGVLAKILQYLFVLGMPNKGMICFVSSAITTMMSMFSRPDRVLNGCESHVQERIIVKKGRGECENRLASGRPQPFPLLLQVESHSLSVEGVIPGDV